MDLETLCKEIALMETPSREEEKRVLTFAEEIRGRVSRALESEGIEALVSLEGSLAKGTWLRNEPEIDIFIQLPTSYPRESLGKTILPIVKKSLNEFRSLERYAEHPYLELYAEDLRLNVVPCYRVRKGEWISATDRTPYHTEYVKSRLDDKLRRDVRLLKRFMKGIGVYGAEIKVGGFSGYLCELLTIYYGSFIDTLSAASNWKRTEFIDLEKHYADVKEAIKFFGSPLIVVDPVDKLRNVASSVRSEKKSLFTVAARAFLQNPKREFFYPKRVVPYDLPRLKSNVLKRGSAIIFIKFTKPNLVPDVLWGQLYKASRAVSSTLDRHGFKTLRKAVWSDEDKNHVLIFEIENMNLPPIKRHLGPPVFEAEDSKRFLTKHLNSESTLSGPTVEGDRWVVYTQRRYLDPVDLLEDKLKDGGRSIGVPEDLTEAMKDSREILVNMEVSTFYSSNPKFAEFLTDFITGRPRWLESTY
ncbi:MAG TPA: CCA tRNA nucleotidyltransferase [Candidatus Bathyarchaeota archaeon]|nr:CCA tRNA nucleotidyltransferase [Candidatus Bathyarchaeota archaeon]